MEFKNIFKKISEDEELQKLRSHYTQLLENMVFSQELLGFGSWTYDIRADEFFWSDEIYRIFDSSPKLLGADGRGFYRFVYSEDLDRVREEFEAAKAGRGYEINFRVLTDKNKKKDVNEKVTVVFDNGGKPTKLIGIIREVREEKKSVRPSGEEDSDRANVELDRYRVLFSQINELAKIAFWERDLDTNINFWSKEAYEIFGVDKDSYENSFENFLKLIHPEDRDYIEDTMKDPREEFLDMEFRIIRPDGDQRHIHQVVMFSFDENDKPYYAQGTIKDITEKSNLIRNIGLKDRELRSIQKKYELLIKQSSDIFCIISKDYEIKYVNEVFERILGYEVENVGGSNFLDYFDEPEKSELRGVIEKIKSGSSESIGRDIGVKTRYGQSRYLEIQVENSSDDNIVDGILINMRDITQRHNAEERLKYLSTHDGITALANKRYLKKHIRDLSDREDFTKSRFSLMMVDIREISDISGSLGSKVEEELLFQIIDKISQILKEDDLLVRYSEYRLAILTSGFISEYHDLAKGIVSIFSSPFVTDQYELLLSTSVGITIYPKDLNNEHSIIECAKIAMMQASQEGKNKYSFFSEDIDIYHYRKFILRKDLKNAIANEQLRVRYQPIVDINTNKLLAAEASIVWIHPEWGEIEADEFLWLLSENNLIGDMENWAINRIFKDLNIWNSKKYPSIKIAINISSVQFYEKRFIETCSQKLEEYELDGDSIIVKIDDKLLSQDSDKAKEIIDSLRQSKINIAIDSLRTGHFFLQHLNKFDVDILKLDKTFLEKSTDEDKNKIIFGSFIKLIKDLDLKLILEGVENWEQIKALYDLKIVAVQGPLFEDPIAISEFEKLLKQGKCPPKLSKISDFSLIEERRKYYRIDFSQYLESEMSIMRIKDKKVNVGKSYALIADIGPGGLAFVSDIKFPVEKNVILEFKTELLKREVRAYGNLLWVEDFEKGLYKYGIEFTIDENDRDKLISVLNQVQVKMKKDILFADGSFTNKSPSRYFKKEN